VFSAEIGWPRPATRNAILRRFNAASTDQETGEAAKSFRW
jgi:hypothetical protein